MATEIQVRSGVQLTYDARQHCTVIQDGGKTLAVDCPYTGGGKEFSPGSLVAAGLAGCMSLSMGTIAQRNDIDITGMTVAVELTMIDSPESRIGEIDVTMNMPRDYTEKERTKLERSVDARHIKHSFPSEIPISTAFHYPTVG